jgi:hypothetical protein
MTQMPALPVPAQLRTDRLILRSWQVDDAVALLPILEKNYDFLSPWIPAHVATPVPLPQLAERLRAFAGKFNESREWRYGIFAPDACR